MAEQKKKKTVVTAKKKAATAKVTNKSKKKSSPAKKKTNAGAEERRKHFSEQYVPYILGGLALFLLVCMVLHFAKPGAEASEHLMGYVGYGICYFLFGMFGWMAVCLPVLLGVLAFFWRRACDEGTVVLKSILTGSILVLLSAVIHVFVCVGNGLTYDVVELYNGGAQFTAGGVVGGLLGWLLYTCVRLPGTIVLAIIVLPLLVMLLINVTPAFVFGKIKQAVLDARAAGEEDEDEEEEADEKPKSAKSRKAAKKAADDREDDGDEEELYVPAPKHGVGKTPDTDRQTRRAGEPAAKDGRATLRVDAETGEVLGNEETADTTADTAADELYIPGKGKGKAAAANASVAAASAVDERAPWDDPADEDGSDVAEDTSDKLYIPPSRTDAGSAARTSPRRNRTMVSAAYDRGADDEDAEETVDTMEITMDEDGRDHIVVNVLPQDRTAWTDSSDYHVNGLTDEEVVVPSGHAAGAEVAEADMKSQEYQFPPVDLLVKGPDHYEADEAEIIKNTQALRGVLESFHIRVKDISCSCGPTITRYEVRPDVGVRVRSIANLVDDIALGLAKSGVRIEAPIPGKSAVGIEVPNANPSTVALRNLIETPEFIHHKSRIAACLGADVAGRPVIMDINKMPHMLVAGATGSGKSVCINSIIMSIIYKAKPEEVKLILIDPKKVEFAVYRDLPHLYAPIVSDPKKAAGCLNSAVNEMERRFELIEEVGVRNLAGYNEVTAGDPERPPLPQMVIIIDELADLMMTASNEVETAICRLAQKARAAGIHLILGTQRPSTDVITGLIKANIPSRIAFTVASQIDSRTIIDSMGAEKLIGRGDMLYAPVGVTKPLRVQGAFVSDGEVEKVITYLKEHNERVAFDENFMRSIEIEAAKCGNGKKGGGGGGDDFGAVGGGDDEDAKFWAAVELAVDAEKVSTSLLQRRLEVGYGRAAKIIDRMEDMGFVGPADGNKPRKLLITRQDLMELRMNGGGSEE